jgi:hypothetical protein
MAQIELRIAREREDRDATRASSEAAIEQAQTTLTTQASDLGLLLQQVANTCALVAERVEADRAERRVFAEAIARLTQSIGAPAEPGERPLGGTVFPAAEIAPSPEPVTSEHDIDLRAATEQVAEDAEPRPFEAPAADDAPQEETIDLRTETQPPRPPRTIPRWATRRS